jgi:hypothetical protein
MKPEQINVTFKVGRRYLVKDSRSRINYGEMFEIKILEMSPGGMVKVKYLIEDGGTMWKSPHDFEIIECLDHCKWVETKGAGE